MRGVSTASISPDELEAALASLSEPSRTVFLLHARDQLPLDEVAQQLELPLPDIERHLVFALVALDRQIGAISPADPVAPCPVDR